MGRHWFWWGGGEVKKNDRMGGALEMFVRNVKKQIQTSR